MFAKAKRSEATIRDATQSLGTDERRAAVAVKRIAENAMAWRSADLLRKCSEAHRKTQNPRQRELAGNAERMVSMMMTQVLYPKIKELTREESPMTEENPYEFPDPMPDWVCPTCGAEWFDEGNGRHSTHSFLRNILTRHMMSASQERCWMCADTGATVRDRIAFMLEKPERATTFICQFYGVYVDGLVGDMERIEAALNLMADDEDSEMILELTEDISLNYEDEFTEFCLDRR